MKRIAVGGITLGVRVEGAGPPLVLLHGFPLSHAMWDFQVDALSAHHLVIAPDLRGHGTSESTPGTVTMARMADDVAMLLDRLEVTQPVVLCGLSMGGYVAWEFWRSHRRRLQSLVLCDTRAGADSPTTAKARQLMAAQVMQDGSQVAVDAMLPKLFAPRTYVEQPELVERVEQTILATDPVGIAATQRGMAVREDMGSLLSSIDVPALVVCGAEDQISPPSEMQALADALPQGRFVEIPAAGHLPPLEQPQTTTEAIAEFMD